MNLPKTLNPSNLSKVLKFPPILFFTVILLGAIIVNGYAVLTGGEEDKEVKEMRQMMVDMLEPTALVSQNVITKPSKLSITVYALAPGMKMDYSGFYAKIVIYTPKGEVYAVKEGVIGENQKATFEVDVSKDAPEGRYTIIPMVGEGPSQPVMGDSVFFEVR
jgi:hypothetical protein